MVRSVTILGTQYKVTKQSMEDHGDVDFNTKVIRIKKEDPADVQERTLLHEIIHAVHYESGHLFNIEDVEEGLVRVTESCLWDLGYRMMPSKKKK